MSTNRCNARTAADGRCNLAKHACSNSSHKGTTEDAERFMPGPVEEAFENRDLRTISWYWLERLTREFDARNATPAAGWARMVHGLGEEPADEAAAAAEAALFGSVMHGIPPRDAAQWEIVERLFDRETVEDLRRWRPNPFTLRERTSPPDPGEWSEAQARTTTWAEAEKD